MCTSELTKVSVAVSAGIALLAGMATLLAMRAVARARRASSDRQRGYPAVLKEVLDRARARQLELEPDRLAPPPPPSPSLVPSESEQRQVVTEPVSGLEISSHGQRPRLLGRHEDGEEDSDGRTEARSPQK